VKDGGQKILDLIVDTLWKSTDTHCSYTYICIVKYSK